MPGDERKAPADPDRANPGRGNADRSDRKEVRTRRLCLQESGKCGIILLDAETGPNTRKKFRDLCERAGVPLGVLPEGLMEEATGKANRVAALKKGAFAEQMAACL